MADSEYGEKTEKPTPRRREQAHEKGQFARSRDLSAALLLLGMLVLLRLFGEGIMQAMTEVLRTFLSAEALADSTGADLRDLVISAVVRCAVALAPLLLGITVLLALVNLWQTGFHMSRKVLTPNFAALNPLKGLKRIFSPGEAGGKLAINSLKLIVVGAAGYSAIHGRLSEIVLASTLTQMQALSLGAGIVWSIGLRIGLVLLILAIIDYIYQLWRNEKKLMMTKQEVKDEMKQMDVDPKIKNRRRNIQLQQAMLRMQSDVPRADVVVTNPTEIAIALRYDPDTMRAPRVVAKGRGYIALKIRQIAVANGVPILERKPLARALFQLVEVGQEIPEQFYSAVAEILAYVWELSGKLTGRRRRLSPAMV